MTGQRTKQSRDAFTDSRYHEHLNRFRHLEGWLPRPAAAMMAFLLDCQKADGIKGNIFEIGVYKGRSAALLGLYAAPDEEVVLCDLAFAAETRTELTDVTAGKCRFLAKRSMDIDVATDLPQDGSRFRFVHIDGNHSGTDVTHELKMADNLLHPNGIICVDDFFNPQYPQVTDALLHYLRQNPYALSMFLCGFGKAFLGRPTTVNTYMRRIAGSLPEYLRDNRLMALTLVKPTVPSEMNCLSLVQNRSLMEKARHGPDWEGGVFKPDF